jgi:hypothetical protein
MFAPAHDNPACLRQGDIIGDLFFPLTRPALLKYLATYGSGSGIDVKLEPFSEIPPGSKKKYVQSLCHGVVAHGAVISQCCDLDKKHPKPSFSLCRLILFEQAKYRNVEALLNNIDPWGQENPHFQFFYLGPIGGLEGEYLADFGLLTSLGWADYDVALAKKVHQLDDLNRNKFRVKVGAFFSRPTDEDTAAGLGNPYGPAAPAAPSLFERLRGILRSRSQ